jgi:hypothetical protein
MVYAGQVWEKVSLSWVSGLIQNLWQNDHQETKSKVAPALPPGNQITPGSGTG